MQLGSTDLVRQSWFISASMTTLPRDPDKAPRQNYDLTESSSDVDREQLLVAARAAGDRLSALALRGEHDASWIGLTTMGRNRSQLIPLGPDLYNGLPGVALFLARLGAVTSEERYTDLALAAMAALRQRLRRSGEALRDVGSFTGWGGVIYALTQLGVLWDQPHLFSEAAQLVPLLPPLIEQDEQLDIIAGSAGCAASLLGLLRYAPSERILDAASQCGDRLLARAVPMEHGIGWIAGDAQSQPLTGFSHGAAGVASVLLELAEATGRARYRQAAYDAITYERSVYSEQEGNWPDFRVDEQVVDVKSADVKPAFMTAWCHGAPGIGLARLRSLPFMDDAETRAEIHIALQTTLRSGFGANHCLCHGDLGNLEFLHLAGERLDSSSWTKRTNRLANAVLDSLNRCGRICGVPWGVESPGLMTGIAGIGYGLLRLAEPERVPSILILESPRQVRAS
jgi:type 2 lantibiotic biosynthesis protein LanM